MELINTGFLSILPPVIAIGLALITKEVISSLVIGVLSGSIIYAASVGGGLGTVLDGTFFALTNRFDTHLILFLAILGALVAVIGMAGGSKAYGDWAASKIKGRTGAQLATSALGVLIFIDDYFNCLTVGAVMKPVTDKFNISRAKLAYIIDATAAPVCIIAPISSWAGSVVSYMADTGMNGMTAFMQAIPYNLYAVLTILMIIVLSITNLEFGPMAKFEENAKKGDLFSNEEAAMDSLKEASENEVISKGKVADLVVPILFLIVACIAAMLYVGGYGAEGVTMFQAFGDTSATVALAYGALVTIIFTFVLFISRRLVTFHQFMDGVSKGVHSMVPAFIILTLAWSMSTICRDMIGTGVYVSDMVANSNIMPELIPAAIFVVAAFLSFSMGTSWGTFGILIPIIIAICEAIGAQDLTIISLSATLAGSVFGDHCSPSSDTTILASTGAGCNHIDHVSSQIPYALTVACCSFVGFLVAGFTRNVIITLVVAVALLLISLKVLHSVSAKKLAAK
ncbi:MAG: Na+/H+ antiporter NhaC family protein [Oscillospiraceae bacterium]|nr:Na+/H+ antiporter NhaC family protein [Oscillospiraceae bacterium]